MAETVRIVDEFIKWWSLQGRLLDDSRNQRPKQRPRKKLQKRNRPWHSATPQTLAEADNAAQLHELSTNDVKLELDSAMIAELNAEGEPTELGSSEVHEMPDGDWPLELEGSKPSYQ